MHFQEALNLVRRGNLASAYLLEGQEDYLAQEFIGAIKAQALTAGTEDFNLSVYELEQATWQDILATANTPPILSSRRLLIVKGSRHPEEVESRALESYLAAPNPSTCLVWWYGGKPDLRGQASRSFAIVQLDTSRDQAMAWARRWAKEAGHELEPRAWTELWSQVGSPIDLTRLRQEMEKLFAFAGDAKVITPTMVREVLSSKGETSVFKLLDAVGEKNLIQALAALDDILAWGEPPVRVAFMLARQVRLLLWTKLAFELKEQPEELKLKPFEREKLQRQSRLFSPEQLARSLERLLELDLALKGGAEPREALELAVIDLCV